MHRRVAISTVNLALFFAALFTGIIAFPAATASARQSTQNPSQQNAPAALPSETVWFAVRDSDGRRISGLSEQDVQVFVNGKPQQIASFSQAKSAPLVVGLLMQVSGMRHDTLPYEEIKPAMKFFQSVIRGNDEGFAATFKDNVHSLGAPTSNLEKLERHVRNAESDDLRGPSALYDAILWACEKMLATRPGTQKALVIVADGHDNTSKHGPEDAVEAALQTGTHIYFVSLAYANDHVQGRRRRQIIHNDELFARDTAGGIVFVRRKQDLPAAFAEIADQIRGQYAVTLHIAGKDCDGKLHPIGIRAERSGLLVLAPYRIYVPKACQAAGRN